MGLRRRLDRALRASVVEPVDEFGRTALHYAAGAEGTPDAVAALLEQGADPDAQDTNGHTPLHMAAEHRQVETARMLLAAGARVDVADAHGNQPLWTAVMRSLGDGDLIRALLAAGADPDHRNEHGKSPREAAELIGNYDVKQFFD